MPHRPIGVIVRMPTTEEGIARYKRRMMEVNSDILGDALNHIDAPLEAKRAYLRSLNGKAPWAVRECGQETKEQSMDDPPEG